jgi:hypothetical protein
LYLFEIDSFPMVYAVRALIHSPDTYIGMHDDHERRSSVSHSNSNFIYHSFDF